MSVFGPPNSPAPPPALANHSYPNLENLRVSSPTVVEGFDGGECMSKRPESPNVEVPKVNKRFINHSIGEPLSPSVIFFYC